MRFTFFASCLAFAGSATYTIEEADQFADYLWAQMDSGELSYEEGMALAQQFADDMLLEAQLDEEVGEPIEFSQADAQSGNTMKAVKDWTERHNFTQVDQDAVKRPENICAKHKEWRPCNDDKNCNWNMIHYECEMKK